MSPVKIVIVHMDGNIRLWANAELYTEYKTDIQNRAATSSVKRSLCSVQIACRLIGSLIATNGLTHKSLSKS